MLVLAEAPKETKDVGGGKRGEESQSKGVEQPVQVEKPQSFNQKRVKQVGKQDLQLDVVTDGFIQLQLFVL